MVVFAGLTCGAKMWRDWLWMLAWNPSLPCVSRLELNGSLKDKSCGFIYRNCILCSVLLKATKEWKPLENYNYNEEEINKVNKQAAVCRDKITCKRGREVINEEGSLHTGDIGMWLPGGCLKIIDRVYQKSISSIQNEPCVPAGATPEPKMLLDFLQTLKSSEESLREQLEKAKKKEAAFIVTFAKREQEIAELKVSCSTLFLPPLPFVAISDYKQSLQFRDLNEKKNIRLEVIRGGRRIEISIYCRWQWCYALMASGSDDALKSVGLVLAGLTN
ncbi:hypothetical protein HN873_032094 [Arachis hypogaea]